MLKLAQDVVGLQVPVCYPMVMKEGQCISHLLDYTAGLTLSEPLSPLNVSKQRS